MVLMESLQSVCSPMCLSMETTSTKWKKPELSDQMANVPQCSKIENQENGREFETGIVGMVAQHDADTWWFVIYNSIIIFVRLSYSGHQDTNFDTISMMSHD